MHGHGPTTPNTSVHAALASLACPAGHPLRRAGARLRGVVNAWNVGETGSDQQAGRHEGMNGRNRVVAAVAVVLAATLVFAAPAIPAVFTRQHLVAVLLWGLPVVGRFVPAPCYDQGPGKPLYCEGGPVQYAGVAIAVALSILSYQLLLYGGMLWLSLHQRGAARKRRPGSSTA